MKMALSHVAIAVPEISKIADKLKALALEIDVIHEVATEKVRAAMVLTPVSSRFRIELLEPTAMDSPISKFLQDRPKGGVHHLSFEVTKLEDWVSVLNKNGMEILPPGIRKGARGKALFIHPKCFAGVLVELEEII